MAALYRALYLLVGLVVGAASVVVAAIAAIAEGEAARRLRERRGLWEGWPGSGDPDGPGDGDWAWLHAASVGEAEMALALAAVLEAERPGLRIVISTMTSGGLARLRRRKSVESHYFPIDFPIFLKRIVDPRPPRLFVAIETEIWPEALGLLQARGVPTAVVNGRISDRSWPRYRLLRPLLARVLGGLALVGARDDEAARRWISLGAREAATTVTGNMKFDLAVPGKQEEVPSLIEDGEGGPVLLAASTHEGEDGPVLDAFVAVRSRHPQARLLLAPRHPRRAPSVLGEARSRWLAAVAWTDVVGIAGAARSPAELAGLGDPVDTTVVPGVAATWPARVDVIVLDRMGLLRSAYVSARACFVGGSLVAGPGGHNLLEAAVGLCPASSGPQLANVLDQAGILGGGGALTIVEDHVELSKFWMEVLDDPAKRMNAAGQARERIRERCGALERNALALLDLLGPPR